MSQWGALQSSFQTGKRTFHSISNELLQFSNQVKVYWSNLHQSHSFSWPCYNNSNWLNFDECFYDYFSELQTHLAFESIVMSIVRTFAGSRTPHSTSWYNVWHDNTLRCTLSDKHCSLRKFSSSIDDSFFDASFFCCSMAFDIFCNAFDSWSTFFWLTICFNSSIFFIPCRKKNKKKLIQNDQMLHFFDFVFVYILVMYSLQLRCRLFIPQMS